MNTKDRWRFVLFLAVLGAFYFIPFNNGAVSRSILEAFLMLQEYVRRHILLCLIPALFIAGAIANFVRQEEVLKYFGAEAKKIVSYAVASVSGSVLAVCSCTVLPLFASIYKKGAGIGPATAFLYSGPAINVLAIILTVRVLGFEIGIARAAGAIVFSVVIGLLMELFFAGEEQKKLQKRAVAQLDLDETTKPAWKTGLYFLTLICIIIFINWSKGDHTPAWNLIYRYKFAITGGWLAVLFYMIIFWFEKEELKSWVNSAWEFTKLILPLLFIGVFAAGFLFGRPGYQGIVPSRWVARFVGGNSLTSNLFASVVGALMYFATLTEIPILQGLLGAGMGKGPALALLLAGPALSLPNMLVVRTIIGTKKMSVYVVLVVIMATCSGMLYGYIF